VDRRKANSEEWKTGGFERSGQAGGYTTGKGDILGRGIYWVKAYLVDSTTRLVRCKVGAERQVKTAGVAGTHR
jgi:hypothetical protein